MEQALSPSQLARAIGVSESSLKRWVDEGALHASRTVGGHRRIALQEAVRFIREIGATVVRPDLLGLSELGVLPVDWANADEDLDQRLYQALEAGENAKSRELIQALYLAGWSPAAIFDGPLKQAMHKIGTLWLHAEWGIVVEHRATNIAIQAISQMRQLFPRHAEGAPFALGGALSDDPYILPSLMASMVLADRGFCDVNLGPITPLSVLKNAAHYYNARLVWVALSVSTDVDALMVELKEYAEELHSRGATLVVGGRGVAGVAAERFTGMHLCTSMRGLAELADSLLEPGKEIALDQRTGKRAGPKGFKAE